MRRGAVSGPIVRHPYISGCHSRILANLNRIILRAFQGVGGGGCFALTTAMLTELVPPHKYAKYTANLSVIFAVSLLCGPILGGAISSRSTWRWVFLLKYVRFLPRIPTATHINTSYQRACRNSSTYNCNLCLAQQFPLPWKAYSLPKYMEDQVFQAIKSENRWSGRHSPPLRHIIYNRRLWGSRVPLSMEVRLCDKLALCIRLTMDHIANLGTICHEPQYHNGARPPMAILQKPDHA